MSENKEKSWITVNEELLYNMNEILDISADAFVEYMKDKYEKYTHYVEYKNTYTLDECVFVDIIYKLNKNKKNIEQFLMHDKKILTTSHNYKVSYGRVSKKILCKRKKMDKD